MRLLIVAPAFLPAYAHGGVPRSSFGLSQGLAQLGHEVRIVTTNRNGEGRLDLRADRFVDYRGLEVCYCTASKGSYLYCRKAGGILAEEMKKADWALHQGTTWTHLGLLAARAGRRSGQPYVIWPRGVFAGAALAISPARKRVYWSLCMRNWYRRAAAVVATGAGEVEQIRGMGIAGAVEVIPNGIDMEGLDDFAGRDELRERFGEGIEGRIILALGRLCPIKGLEYLIEAFSLVAQRFDQAVLVIAGPDENGYQAELRSRARVRGLNGKVVFTGRVEGREKVGLLRAAEVLAMPSGSESFGMSGAEAAACAVPVVLTRGCGISQAMDKARAGLVVSQQACEIAEAINTLLEDDGLRAKMGGNGRRLIESEFSWAKAAKRTEELVRGLLN